MLTKGLAKEGQNIFESGSMNGIAITLFVRNPNVRKRGEIFYHDIGDDLNRDEKLANLAIFGSVDGMGRTGEWESVTPDTHGDWIRQRDDSFSQFIALGEKRSDGSKLFGNFSLGVSTNRDPWCYNASRAAVQSNMTRTIAFYTDEVARFDKAFDKLDRKARKEGVDDFVDADSTKIKWTVNLKDDLVRSYDVVFDPTCLMPSLYRPFTKQWLYFNRTFNERVLRMPRIFPNVAAENRAICVSGIGGRSGFSALITNTLPNLDLIEKGQCFPLYLYDEAAAVDDNTSPPGLFDQPQTVPGATARRDAITDDGLLHFQSAYPREAITKEDLFYYVYGLLHSADYRGRYADNFTKELPRIPRVKTAADFREFSNAGRALADLHIHYETVPMYAGAKIDTGGKKLADADYRVEKMKVPKMGGQEDLTRLVYNANITVTGIPPEAYDYVVSGKPVLDWVIERQRVKTDNASGIVNDANDWAIDTMHNPRYPLELFLRVITVSLETMKIVRSLPTLDIRSDG